MVIAAVLMLTVCACSVREEPVVITRVIRVELPAISREACRKPTVVPNVPRLSQRDAVSIMLRDRSSLVECEAKRAAAVAAIEGTNR